MALKEEIKKGIACDSVGKPDSIIGRTVCLSVHPGKMVLLPFITWFDRRYKGRYTFARLLFSIDLLLIGLIIGLMFTAIFLFFSQPSAFEDDIVFEAAVAPREIVTGASSTLIIRYYNGTDEELRHAALELTYPDHFLLQELSVDETAIKNNVIELGTIPVGGTGSVRVRGVMFGDVGGEQSFTSTFTFVHGTQREMAGRKVSVHTFSPSASTLKLRLTLPERLVAFQTVEGTVTYENTGEIDFPSLVIEPQWPEGFSFLSSPVRLMDGAFLVPAIAAGQSGTVPFTGYLGDVAEQLTFEFYPSFTFDTQKYKQETLTHIAQVVPAQIRIEHSVDKTTVRAGGETIVTVRYENIGEFDVDDVVVSIELDSPFVPSSTNLARSIGSVASGMSGEAEIHILLRESIDASETQVWESLDLVTRVVTQYTLGDGSVQRVTSKSLTLSTPITTPVVFESFGRYATDSGDQLGRGPLPPRVDTETKYWIFWYVGGTINELHHVQIEGTLGEGVTFTGKQSSYQNSGVEYDASTNTIRWETSAIEPNLAPTSKIVGVAFELGLTPEESMIGQIPTLLSDVRFTGTDARTGVFISRSGESVTTDLPEDLMATGKAIVEE